jgi:site-specific recombinase XerD
VYIEKRRRKYFALHTIPEDVRAALGGHVRFTAALDTDSLKVAQTRARVLEVRWRRLIDQARNQSTDQIERDALWWRELVNDAPEHEKRLALDALADEAQARVDREASRAGFVDHRQAGFDDLPVHDEVERFHAIATGKLVKLDEHLDEYLATLGNESKTVDMKRSTVRKFSTAFPYITDVRRKDVQRWANERAEEGKKPATVRRALSELRGYWTYLLSIEAASANNLPFEKLTIPKSGKNGRADERKPFEPADVVKLLDAARSRKDASLADLIELAMWSGARIEEIAALKVANASADVLKIEDAKTAAGWRQVPVHSKLKAAVKRLVETSTDGYLLSGLTPNKYGDRSNAIGKRFGTLKRALGFGEDRVFHSIRRTVATLLEDSGVPEGVAADIIGHEKTTMTYGLYSGGASLETKRQAVEKLNYPRP